MRVIEQAMEMTTTQKIKRLQVESVIKATDPGIIEKV